MDYNASEYLPLLKQYADYDNRPITDIPCFQYAESTSEDLQQLRLAYKLDEVAGQNREVDQIIRLMRWVHVTIKHGGDTINPEPRNALNILSAYEREQRGVNCRMLATVLNEVYLAMGFTSRHITCLPYDKKDTECHVINIVYSNTERRWLYMDPTHEAYFMDSSASILGIREVRERMIAGESLCLNSEINWNGTPSEPEKYKAYMSKNSFRFSCPLASEFGYESKDGPRSWLSLNPLGYDSNRSDEPDPSNSYVQNYFTHNADTFWAPPS